METADLLYLPRARDTVSTEIQRTEAEYKSLAKFGARIEQLPQVSQRETMTQSQTTQSLVVHNRGSPTLAQVRTAYRDTVMSVPHYTEEYDEPFEQHIATELGEELAAAITSGQQLTPQLKNAILEATHLARESREELSLKCQREYSTLERAEALLKGSLDAQSDPTDLTNNSFVDLLDTWSEYRTKEKELADLCETRQSQLHRRNPGSGNVDISLCVYLYASLPVTYPVLAETARILRQRRAVQHRIEWLLARLD